MNKISYSQGGLIMQLIKTEKDRCHECYACVRNCPVKALRVKDGQAEVINERCINCVNCFNVCSQGAKKIVNYITEVKELLKSDREVVAGIAPSFPAYNPEMRLKDWENILTTAGFSGVYEVAWGAQLITRKYKEYLQKTDKPVISSACPVIVKLVEKYYPNLVPYLAPIVSPMGALVNYIKKVEGPDKEIVLIGPCHAKKAEFAENVDVAAVLTFTELSEILKETQEKSFNIDNNKIADNIYPLSKKVEKPDKVARGIPLAGGLLKGVCEKREKNSYIKVEGHDKIEELFNFMADGELKPEFVDALYCEGCINGLDLSDNNFYKKELALNKFINSSEILNKVNYDDSYYENINMDKKFEVDYQHLPQPDEDEIWEILNKTNKYEDKDLLNCGACGYNTCWDKAIAVYQGLAEVEMCLPYLLSEKRSEIEKVNELNNELDNIINSSFDGMAVVSNEGKIVRLNDSYQDMIGISHDNIIGRSLSELENERVIYPSVSLLCLLEKRSITLVQNTKNGKRILVTATPLFESKDKIKRVIVNARDINELDVIVDDIEDEIYLSKSSNIGDDCGAGNIIYDSQQMRNIIKLSRKIGNTASTVLITGDSGVGKEVVARYIHEQSESRENFVKINCAAIPERLLESELFGYETGAFSGARREGKPGLIEKAENGTLFLDEIGEMPLNMQAKLLQVIQEHRVIRIGGVDPIEVDFRLITATNRDIKEMVTNNNFREDLFYRLNVVPINVPPLKERKEDIIPLVIHFTNLFNEKYNKKIKFNKESKQLLYKYNWPGNVRELINLLERVIVTTESRIINEDFLKSFIDFKPNRGETGVIINSIMPIKDAVAEVEKKLLVMAKEEGKSTYDMAKILGVNQSTIVRKLNKYFE